MRGRPRARNGRRNRALALALVALALGLGVSVRRSAQGTRIAAELAELQREERALDRRRSRSGCGSTRWSPGSASWRLPGLGLRPSTEAEILYLPDVAAPPAPGGSR